MNRYTNKANVGVNGEPFGVNKGVADKIRRPSALTEKAFWRSLNAYIH